MYGTNYSTLLELKPKRKGNKKSLINSRFLIYLLGLRIQFFYSISIHSARHLCCVFLQEI